MTLLSWYNFVVYHLSVMKDKTRGGMNLRACIDGKMGDMVAQVQTGKTAWVLREHIPVQQTPVNE